MTYHPSHFESISPPISLLEFLESFDAFVLLFPQELEFVLHVEGFSIKAQSIWTLISKFPVLSFFSPNFFTHLSNHFLDLN
jgi:hypothetical protein